MQKLSRYLLFFLTFSLHASTISPAQKSKIKKPSKSPHTQTLRNAKEREKARNSIKKNSIPQKASAPKKHATKKHVAKRRRTKKLRQQKAHGSIVSPTIRTTSSTNVSNESAGQQRLRKLRDIIGQLVKQSDKQASIGIKVVLLKNNCVVYEKNADKQFIPASNTKMITAAAAYHILGPEYVYVTKLFTDKRISPHAINNLYIKGAGDPTLNETDLFELIRSLRKLGIREIRGTIIVDATVYNEQGTGPGWSRGDASLYDKAPTSGLMVNHSCIQVYVSPGATGKPPYVSVDPSTNYFKIINKARTTSKKGGGLHVIREKGNTLLIKGTISRRSKSKYYRIAVEHPHLFAGSVLESVLRKNKFIIKGKVKAGAVSSTAELLGEHRSEPLTSIVRIMMKASDNLYADALFRTMGAHSFGTPGTWIKGKQAVTEFLEKTVKLSPDEMIVLHNGSGLSHTNQVSPHSLYKLLAWVYTQSPHRAIFIGSLPIGGVDGTLRNRMKHHSVQGSVQAKTGSLTGVTSLSGYITPKTGLPLIFAVMVNRTNKSAVHYKKQLEDQLCSLLAAHAFSTY